MEHLGILKVQLESTMANFVFNVYGHHVYSNMIRLLSSILIFCSLDTNYTKVLHHVMVQQVTKNFG